MILYLDTSSLVKLFVEERGSDQVHAQVNRASVVSTSIIAYAEARSAFARQHRAGGLDEAELLRVKLAFDLDWSNLLAVETTEELCRQAGELAERHALRGFDSLHLASFLLVARSAMPDRVVFSCFDDRLQAAVEEVMAEE